MKSILRVLPTVLILAFGTTALLADRTAKGPGAGIRFVDLQVCFEQHSPVQSEMNSLRDVLNRKLEEFSAREEALNDQIGELQLLDPSTDAYVNRAYSVENSRVSLERDRQFELDRLSAKRLQLFARAYEEVQRAAERLGVERGYDAVLVVPPPNANLPTDLQARVQTLQTRSVLWSNGNLDVTDEVLALLK